MKKFIKVMVDIHASDWKISVMSGALFSAFILTILAGIALAAVLAFTGYDAENATISALLILTGIICFWAWKKYVWDNFVHHLTDLS